LLLLLGVLAPAGRSAAQEKVGAGAPRVGQKAPDFTLPDTAGKRVSLSELLASPAAGAGEANGKTRWVVLIFYRGYW
jgi:peroxiredoxin